MARAEHLVGLAATRLRVVQPSQALWLVLCAGCGGLPPLPPYPGGAAPIAPLGLSEDRPSDGSLRLGDELVVETGTGETRRALVARVDARGQLHVASGRDVPVAGLSLERAEARITEAIRSQDKFAEVSLQLTSRPSQRVSAFGALVRPGTFEFSPAMRIADLIAAAGGILVQTEGTPEPLADIADLDRAALLRNGTALPVSMRQALQGKPGHNVHVHPGDLLYMPFATDGLISVLGQVGTPRVLAPRAGMRLTEALSAAGGVTPGADKSDIRVLRGPVDAPVVYRASLAGIAAGEQNDGTLKANDVLFVEDDPTEDLGEVLDLLIPIAGIGLFVASVVILSGQ